jgi:hypothetical protein
MMQLLQFRHSDSSSPQSLDTLCSSSGAGGGCWQPFYKAAWAPREAGSKQPFGPGPFLFSTLHKQPQYVVCAGCWHPHFISEEPKYYFEGCGRGLRWGPRGGPCAGWPRHVPCWEGVAGLVEGMPPHPYPYPSAVTPTQRSAV